MVDEIVPGEQVARDWLLLLDRGDAQTAWQQAASRLQDAFTFENWARVLSATRDLLGPPVDRRLIDAKSGTELPGIPKGEYVVLKFQTTFAKRSATETVTPVRDADGAWRVAGYYVRPTGGQRP
jgi:hypothetical protein